MRKPFLEAFSMIFYILGLTAFMDDDFKAMVFFMFSSLIMLIVSKED